jgi:hypothetical protein
LHYVHKIELDNLQNKSSSLLSNKLNHSPSPIKQQSTLYNFQKYSPAIQTDASFSITRSSNDLTSFFESNPNNISINNNITNNNNNNNNENLKSMEDFYNASNQLSSSFDINSDINSSTAAKILTNTISTPSLNAPDQRIRTPGSFQPLDMVIDNTKNNQSSITKQPSSVLKSSNLTRNYQFKSSISNLQHDLNPNISVDNVDDFLESIDKFQSDMKNLQDN